VTAPGAARRVYVRGLLQGRDLADLVDVASRVLAEWDDDALQALVDLAGARGVRGELKNLIFASTRAQARDRAPRRSQQRRRNHPGGRQVFGLRPASARAGPDLVQHSRAGGPKPTCTRPTSTPPPGTSGRGSTSASTANPERILFNTYTKRYGQDPTTLALLPQVWLHYDPYLRPNPQQRPGAVIRQRMDFLLLAPGRRRVVLEVDGRHHYATDDGRAAPSRYATMVAEDRRLRLTGYEVYRFGGAEFTRP
jgi:hypothetical protein